MQHRTLDELNVMSAQMDLAAAFLVKNLAAGELQGAWRDANMLTNWLASRPWIPRSVAGLVVKAATAPLDSSNASALSNPSSRAFLELADRRAVLPQLGAVKLGPHGTYNMQISDATMSWVGEGAPKPIQAISFDGGSLTPRKQQGSIVMSEELVTLSVPDSVGIVTRGLVSVSSKAFNIAVLDPTVTAIPNIRPASLTNGLTPVTAAGDFANNIGQVLMGISGGSPGSPVIVVSLQTAVRLQGLRDLEAAGIRVLVSSAAENRIIAIDADGVAFIDGGAEIRVGQPDLEMRDDPADPTTAATVMISLWQRGLVAITVERRINWVKRPDAVSYLELA